MLFHDYSLVDRKGRTRKAGEVLIGIMTDKINIEAHSVIAYIGQPDEALDPGSEDCAIDYSRPSHAGIAMDGAGSPTGFTRNQRDWTEWENSADGY
ncbi:hypothetical protein J2Z37_003717 [Ammoniphilus resinae]|uniref:Transposase n=1 Tax=Ammoniphilus resinae TaxID=861532 RepID=A0ABS4GTW9_9BACL|nr:hypothetical protein [Ammoniphilus resinae]MBP1933704.1 hypothetical protein [Ammoniphilus resinae]